ncbi:type II secretion system protein GspM [Propionivibrio sp.]|uniref:type II secretion system protein GspM n=1 Tax=Propionivibrio sp. TaxID=2212460 RepID=UPI003BEFD586
MKEQWLRLAARFDALQLRERRIVAVGVLGSIVLIAYSLFIEPALKRAQLADRSSAEHRVQLASLQVQKLALQSPEQDPELAARAELASLKKQLAELSFRLSEMEGSLAPPQRMSGLLEDMIGRKTALRLLSLKTLPVAPLIEKKAGAEETATAKPADTLANPPAKPANTSAGLYKHGVEIRLEGSYQELAAYLERLEQSKVKLLWSSVALSAENHPKLVLSLTVYTLSLDRAWLIV